MPTGHPLGDVPGSDSAGCSPSWKVPHDVKIYPGVSHGFMNDHDPADVTLLLRFLARISRTKYDEEATRDARRRITAFFNTHLRGTAN